MTSSPPSRTMPTAHPPHKTTTRPLKEWLTLLPIAALFALFFLYPLSSSLFKAFCLGDSCSLAFITSVLDSPSLKHGMLTSLLVALTVTILAALIGVPLALLLERRTFIGKSLVRILILAPLLMPPFVGALALRQLFGRFGSINLILMRLNIISNPIDWFGAYPYLGLAILEAFHFYPLILLSVRAALRELDTSLEEAALSAGCSPARTLRLITLPLLKPALFGGMALVFIGSLTELGTPLLFEARHLIPVQLYYLINDANENNLGYSLILVLTLISITVFLTAQQALVGDALVSSSRIGRKREQKPLPLSTALIIILPLSLVVLMAVLPHIGVLLLSLSKTWFMSILPTNWTFTHFTEALTHRITSTAIKNSLIMSTISTALDLVFGLATALLIVRGRTIPRRLLDAFVMLPLVVPGIVIAFGYLTAFAKTPLDSRVYPIPLLIIAYAVRRFPFMVRSCVSGLQQSSISLEEAAATVGLNPWQIIRQITIPLISAHIFAGAIMCFSFAMIEVSDSIILALEEPFYPLSKALLVLSGRPDGTGIAAALAVMVIAVIFSSIMVAVKLVGRRR